MAPAEAPLVGRPSDYFYNAIGQHVRLEMSAKPTEVEVEGGIELILRVTGAENPAEIHRPDLRQVDEYARAFHIDDLDESSNAGIEAGSRTFRYHLRPKNEGVKEI